MPMLQALAIFGCSLAVALLAAGLRRQPREQLKQPRFWLFLLAGAAASSATSALVASSRRAGTGFTTSHGWPKPFYFRYLSETGVRSQGWDALYFAGNSLAWAGALLVLWSAWRLLRR